MKQTIFVILSYLLFNIKNAMPILRISEYENIAFKLTDSHLKRDVRFFLYTRNNPHNGQQLWIDDLQVLATSFYNSNISTKFITHGWFSNYNSESCTAVRDGFLTHDFYNVIVVDWSIIAKTNYIAASSRVRVIGGYVAKMIDLLVSQGNDPNSMSLVGHSLGAHIMGSAGFQASQKIGHIVGLDPAAPGFGLRGSGNEIGKGDASLVEVIHTNVGFLGIYSPIGDVDFYPNGGGLTQPGCPVGFTDNCSHLRAFYFYAESLVEPDKWFAVRCYMYFFFKSGLCKNNEIVAFPRWAPIEKPKGIYMLRTNAQKPFGIGLAGI